MGLYPIYDICGLLSLIRSSVSSILMELAEVKLITISETVPVTANTCVGVHGLSLVIMHHIM